MSNRKELAEKYRHQLYHYLRDSYGGDDKPLKRDLAKDAIIIGAYERAISELGLIPETEEILKEVNHDNKAVLYSLQGINCLETLFYRPFKAINHVIENKYQYIGKVIDLKEIKAFQRFLKFSPLEDYKGEIVGIGKNSICLKDSKGNKEFCWYLPPPLYLDNKNGHGAELAIYIIEKYGE